MGRIHDAVDEWYNIGLLCHLGMHFFVQIVFRKIFIKVFETEPQVLLRLVGHTLQRTNTENSKQIFPEKELRGHSPNFHYHVSVSDLYIPTIDLPILLQEILHVDRSREYINSSQTQEYGN